MKKIMIDRTLSNEFLLFFQCYLTFYREFLDLETEKYNDIISNNLTSLNDHIANEQAYMLKSRGLELDRDKLMTQAGMPNATFKVLIPCLEESVQDEVLVLYNSLSQVLLDLKHTNLRCNYLTKLKLHRINIDLKKIENHPELQKLYNAQAKEKGVSSSILSKRV